MILIHIIHSSKAIRKKRKRKLRSEFLIHSQCSSKNTTGRMNDDFSTESRNTWLENVKHYYWNPFRYYTNYKHFSLFGQRFMFVYIYIHNIGSHSSLAQFEWLTGWVVYDSVTRRKQQQNIRPNKILWLLVVKLLLLFSNCCDSDFMNTYTALTHTYGRYLTLACHLITTLSYSLLYVCVPSNWIQWSLWFCWFYYQ